MKLAELKNTTLSFNRAELRKVYIGTDKKLDAEHRAVWNLDKEKVSSIVSDRYNLVQHADVVNSVIEALTNLNIHAEARVGNADDVLIVDLTFPDAKIDIQKGEEFFTGIRIINSYNKTTGVMVLPRLVRLACTNGMVVNVGWVHEYSVAHTNKMAKDFEKIIPQLIKEMANSNDKFKAYINKCIGDSAEWEMLEPVIKTLFTAEKHREAITEILRRAKDEAFTRWDLYNAITDYATHGEQIKPLVEKRLQTIAQRVLVTPLARLSEEEATA